MASGSFRFERFVLDTRNRQLRRDDAVVDLNARYFEALALLVREGGRLVSKDQFLQDVWRGVPVTDEALTQCIKTLRRQLGDSASAPRFIETVPKHGYRFVAPVDAQDALAPPVSKPAPPTPVVPPSPWSQAIMLGTAGTLGGGAAGFAGGLVYGFASAGEPGTGAVSVLVLVCVTMLTALVGAAGVAFGIAGAGIVSNRPGARIVGAALGGLIVGALVKLIGLDAFDLLFGQTPGDITGAIEGAVLGGAVGVGAWLAAKRSARHGITLAALTGGVAGAAIPLFGGRLMGGSLDLLARSFPQSHLRLDPIGHLLGESDFGRISQIVTGGLEGALFGGCIVGAMMLARRRRDAGAAAGT